MQTRTGKRRSSNSRGGAGGRDGLRQDEPRQIIFSLGVGNHSSIRANRISTPLTVHQIPTNSHSGPACALPGPRGRFRAFTLVEMLVVIVIIAIVLAFLITAL